MLLLSLGLRLRVASSDVLPPLRCKRFSAHQLGGAAEAFAFVFALSSLSLGLSSEDN